MFVRTLRRCCVSDVLAIIKSGGHMKTLLQLNEKKRLRQREENVDYLRALCFLVGMKDALHARQALLEELRHFPGNRAAQNLLYEINGSVRPLLLPPPELSEEEPLFGLLCDALLDHTMLTWARLYGLYLSAKDLCLQNEQTGAVVECGVSAGGSAVLLAVVAAHYAKRPIKVYALDSFDGMPEPSPHDVLTGDGDNSMPAEGGTLWGSGTCSALQENVQRLARNFDVEKQLVVVPGLFHETLPGVLEEIGAGGISLLHLDADWYESTRCVLNLVWPAMRPGGLAQVDDYYYWAGCRKAVDEFIGTHSVQLESVDSNAVRLVKK
ncbi:Macrocin O methyltransferase (TylF) Methyltransferase domain [Trypanosoma vivax]|uniref:Macrocin-O-methyltransferase domain-containing protein n=1 Tax=Trypanosoma vivax (strain Y486) TaxID=1055687 RepID=G0U7M8_TRYVY|nr:hypothetical protein TRVL_00397 [Trypanosoma vivax]KAH8620494.1 Macrocin O methyltransferase (TylF) Methyltransferase domain [Trypanosoma vivax]CCC51886.1 conserved hypothetical protein [Trypanosoma vivax Y486]